ncbi:MAG: hypothetical protein A2Y77_14095 [Planctomycetes bacterium RBG_13_62_9]|nr:MAG: hypothetical protein A2Y77_14095 [Planctomycetes bacterium RBG_13_62_9]
MEMPAQPQREQGNEPAIRIYAKIRKFLLPLWRQWGIICPFSLLLVQDGGLAIRYWPHLESTVVLGIHEKSLTDERAT